MGTVYLGCEKVDWIRLTQDRDQRPLLVMKVMNFRLLQNAGDLLANDNVTC